MRRLLLTATPIKFDGPGAQDPQVAKHVVYESDEFIKAFGNPNAHEDRYRRMIREFCRVFTRQPSPWEK